MRICKNKITDLIRDHFDANPLKVPESRIRPMSLLEIQDNKPQYLGGFKYLVKGAIPPLPSVNQSTVPGISGLKSRKVNFNAGFRILENFLKAFGMDPAVVGTAIQHSKQLAFSFDNVARLYIEPLELGQIISANDIIGNTDNIFIQKIQGNDDLQLALITDVLTSNNFVLNTYRENDTAADIELPLINEYVNDMKLNLNIDSKSGNEIKFSGQEALTFAFSCVELKIDPKTSKFSVGNWLKKIRSTKGNQPASTEPPTVSKLVIDENKANPLLLEL